MIAPTPEAPVPFSTIFDGYTTHLCDYGVRALHVLEAADPGPRTFDRLTSEAAQKAWAAETARGEMHLFWHLAYIVSKTICHPGEMHSFQRAVMLALELLPKNIDNGKLEVLDGRQILHYYCKSLHIDTGN